VWALLVLTSTNSRIRYANDVYYWFSIIKDFLRSWPRMRQEGKHHRPATQSNHPSPPSLAGGSRGLARSPSDRKPRVKPPLGHRDSLHSLHHRSRMPAISRAKPASRSTTVKTSMSKAHAELDLYSFAQPTKWTLPKQAECPTTDPDQLLTSVLKGMQACARAARTDVGPHVDAVPNWNAVPHSDVAPHDDAEW